PERVRLHPRGREGHGQGRRHQGRRTTRSLDQGTAGAGPDGAPSDTEAGPGVRAHVEEVHAALERASGRYQTERPEQAGLSFQISDADREAVERQLGRRLRGRVRVAVRCGCGLPAVIETFPLVDGEPFPTLYWLTCRR